MTPPFFILVSLSRCGSTALCRALNAHTSITCLFEPEFAAAAWQPEAVTARVRELATMAQGIKHVWDPSGFPFTSAHRSDRDEMAAMRDRVVALNRVLLNAAPARIVFLRRRDQLARVLSDAIGQQTDLWGPVTPDGRLPDRVDEVAHYRHAIERRRLQPLDLDVVDWYLAHAAAMEAELRASVPADRRWDVWYEDVFAPELPLARRDARYRELLAFLGYDTAPDRWDRGVVEMVLAPDRKLNTSAILRRIPNLAALARRHPGVLALTASDQAPS